jgi:hypothetical protein
MVGKRKTSSRAPPAKDEEEAGESEYEMQRLQNIKRNQKLLDTLGIGSTLQAVVASQVVTTSRSPRVAKRRKTESGGPRRNLPRKRSSRLAGDQPAEGLLPEEIDEREERRAWDEEELVAQARRNQKGDKKMAGVRSRPSPLPSYPDLLQHDALTCGERVFRTQRKGKQFFGDLLPDGQIGYSKGQKPDHSDLTFPSPTAFNNFCGRLADKNYMKGNGFNYVYHKAPDARHWMPLDYYRWLTFGRSEKPYPKGFTPGDDEVPWISHEKSVGV